MPRVSTLCKTVYLAASFPVFSWVDLKLARGHVCQAAAASYQEQSILTGCEALLRAGEKEKSVECWVLSRGKAKLPGETVSEPCLRWEARFCSSPKAAKLNGSATKTKGKNGLRKPDRMITLWLQRTWRGSLPWTEFPKEWAALPHSQWEHKNHWLKTFSLTSWQRNYAFIVNKTILNKFKIQIFGSKEQENLSQNIV